MRYTQFSDRLLQYNALVTLSSSVIAEEITRYTIFVRTFELVLCMVLF